jgi:citrate lyase beta subunit
VTRLPGKVYRELDDWTRAIDKVFRGDYPGDPVGRQPVHTVYVPADRFTGSTCAQWGAAAIAALDEHGPLPGFDGSVVDRVAAKLRREPIEDLRVDFEDGYGVRDDHTEDAHAAAAGAALRESAPAFFGLRCKSLEGATARRAARTLDVFLDALGPPPDGFVITLPKVTSASQVSAMRGLCRSLEKAHGLPKRRLRFEIQVETPQAVVAPDGNAAVAGLIRAATGRCVGLHYGTYDYSASLGIAAAYQSLEHPAADFAKAVMQVAAAGTGVRVCDGSTNVLPVGETPAVREAWALHARLVRRSLERGFYQGWDLHPAQLPTRYAATYAFFRSAAPAAVARLSAYLDRRSSGILDEPATARALAGFLQRGLDCGALDPSETTILERL